MKAILFAALVAIATSGASAQGLGYKGVPFGAPKDEFLTRFPGVVCSDPGARYRALGDEHCFPDLAAANVENVLPLATYGGQPIKRPTFGLIDGKLGRFTMTIDPSRYEAARDAMTTGIGKGSEVTRSIQTRGGAVVPSRTFTVSRPEGSITLAEHNGRIDEGAISGTSTAFDAYLKRLEQDSAKSGSKDL